MPPKGDAPSLGRSLTFHDDTERTEEDANVSPSVAGSSRGGGGEVEIDVNDVTMYPEVVYRPAPGGTESLNNSEEDPTHSDVEIGRSTFLGETRGRARPPANQRRLRSRNTFFYAFFSLIRPILNRETTGGGKGKGGAGVVRHRSIHAAIYARPDRTYTLTASSPPPTPARISFPSVQLTLFSPLR